MDYLGGCQHFSMGTRGRPPLLTDETILERALADFAQFGYLAMSVRALNAELGLSHETVSKRFGQKDELFRAAVQHGVRLFINDFDRALDEAEPANDTQLLRATVRAFMIASSRHPSLGGLLHHETVGDAQRAVIIADTGLALRIAEAVALLARLRLAGVIHDMHLREVWFLAEGAVAPLHFGDFAKMFDPFDGALDRTAHVERMADAIMRSLLKRPD